MKKPEQFEEASEERTESVRRSFEGYSRHIGILAAIIVPLICYQLDTGFVLRRTPAMELKVASLSLMSIVLVILSLRRPERFNKTCGAFSALVLVFCLARFFESWR